jgi:hypothetical protein
MTSRKLFICEHAVTILTMNHRLFHIPPALPRKVSKPLYMRGALAEKINNGEGREGLGRTQTASCQIPPLHPHPRPPTNEGATQHMVYKIIE